MKKFLFALLAMTFCLGVYAQQEKVRIAVMEFEEGVGLNASEVNGLSDMLINSLFKGGKFSIVERSQLNKVLAELNLQRNTEFSQKDLAKMGELLGVRALILGRVNFLASGKEVKDGAEVLKGEYNVDVRAVLCENGELITTAGATKTDDITYRELMENIAKQLEENLVVPEKVEPIVIPEFRDERMYKKGKRMLTSGIITAGTGVALGVVLSLWNKTDDLMLLDIFPAVVGLGVGVPLIVGGSKRMIRSSHVSEVSFMQKEYSIGKDMNLTAGMNVMHDNILDSNGLGVGLSFSF